MRVPAGVESGLWSRCDERRVDILETSVAGEVSIDADVTIRATRGHARDLDRMKDPGKRNPAERFLAIQTGRLTDIPDQECQCRHQQCTEYGIPDRHILLSGFVDTHRDYQNKNR
jgi:hypothetical protein